ncbi:MAG TPA: DUF742 domain-containing protein [Acidimicrobiales bacterium]
MTETGWDRGLAARVRPYAITGGRTPSTVDLPYETIIQTTATGQRALPRLVLERRRVVDLCALPLSVAEISAHLKVALGVAMVIVGDLKSEGLVATSRPRTSRDDRPDIELLERVLDGLRQL